MRNHHTPKYASSEYLRGWLLNRRKRLDIWRNKAHNFGSGIYLNLLDIIMTAFTKQYEVPDIITATHFTGNDMMGRKRLIRTTKLTSSFFHQSSFVCLISIIHFLFLTRGIYPISPSVVHNKYLQNYSSVVKHINR